MRGWPAESVHCAGQYPEAGRFQYTVVVIDSLLYRRRLKQETVLTLFIFFHHVFEIHKNLR